MASRRIDPWVTNRHRRRESGWKSVVLGMFLREASCVLRAKCFDVHRVVGQRYFQQRWLAGDWDLQKGQCGDQERKYKMSKREDE